jgi:hypothetical protein
MGAIAVPVGTPDPDGDRRFAERAFPLLEPIGWTGERYRGGYGTAGDGRTICLGLVFGPFAPWGFDERIAVDVGDHVAARLWANSMRLGAKLRLVPSYEDLSRRDDFPEPTAHTALVEICGAPVELSAFTLGDRWIGHGRWGEHSVGVHAIRTPPGAIRLQEADEIPGRLHGPPRVS